MLLLHFHARSAIALVALSLIHGVEGQCHNRCSGHGTCDKTGTCECYANWLGGDCSLRRCPHANAWVDYAVGNQQAHQAAECSNRGICDRATGQCACDSGFSGSACQRKGCPNDCSEHGRCVTMAEAAAGYDAFRLNHSFAKYSDYGSNINVLRGGDNADARGSLLQMFG